ncbi:MAG: hypothetical protein HY223_08755 [Thaumarchaeota archaeon]|nr:hypothetical protein [Nitrososphaerota archaeon]
MSKPNFKNFNKQSPIVTGFLGGLTFTGLIFFIQQTNTMKLAPILIPLTAGVSFLFILATIGTMRVSVEGGSVHPDFYKLNIGFILAGLGGIMVMIPLMIWDYNFYSSIVLIIFEIIAVRIFAWKGSKNPKLW